MSCSPVAPRIDGPQSLLTRVEAHVALAESRDRVFTTLPVAVVRELLRQASAALVTPDQRIAL